MCDFTDLELFSKIWSHNNYCSCITFCFIRHSKGLFYDSKLNHFVIKVGVAQKHRDSAIKVRYEI